MKPILIAFVLSFIIITSCNKSVSVTMPPETHTGAFTFGCKVNGKVYSASGKFSPGGFFNDEYVTYYPPGLSLNKVQIHAISSIRSYFRYDLFISSTDTGTYLLKSNDNYGILEETSQSDPTGLKYTYHTTDNYTGSVTITYSKENILAGIFKMDAVNGEGKIIHITDGRFDIGR